MSGKRRPKRSSFGPMSGLVPSRLMWSSITISAPWPNFVLMPPAAFVRISALTPSRPSTRVGKRHGAEVVALVEVRAARQRQHAPARATCPATSLPGVADDARRRPVRNRLVRQRRRPDSGSRRNAPRPEPSTMATSGTAPSAAAQVRRPLPRRDRSQSASRSLTAASPRCTPTRSWRACRRASRASRAAPDRGAARARARRCRRSECRSTRSSRTRTARTSRR